VGIGERFHSPDRIHFLERQDNVGEFYGSADAFLLPSLYDPFPNVCLEAMACGLPVITTRVTGIAEIVTHGKDALLVDEGQDIQALACAMKELADPAKRQSLSQAARTTAEQFSLERNLQANLALYQSLSCP
jgi:UDP-glucose:(heptosyl)LPS alpha-1,3-glucosyltransferase